MKEVVSGVIAEDQLIWERNYSYECHINKRKFNQNKLVINKQNIRCRWECLVLVSGIIDMNSPIYIDLGKGIMDDER